MQLADIEALKKSFTDELAAASSAETVEALRVKYLGRKAGLINEALKSLATISVEEKRTIGPALNALRTEIESALSSVSLATRNSLLATSTVDITAPGIKPEVGHLHPLTQMDRKIRSVFASMNFSIIEGPELETEYYNFDALNIPANHPARDMWDTFWIKNPESANGALQMARSGNNEPRATSHAQRLLMRTHTSPMQARYMETHKPPFQIIVPGRCFRFEATDATHETNFYQFEGLMIGENVSLANFKYVIKESFRGIFGRDLDLRFRPSYFPFTEPSVEVDVRLKGTNKWLELMGAGMVHPQVLKNAGIDPKKWQGFAFGCGIDRLARIMYEVPDIRLFFSGDLRFIKQF